MGDKLSNALTIAEGLIRLAGAVVKAVRSGDVERVDEILPEQLKTSIAKAAADEAARDRFTKPLDADAV